MSVVVLEKFPDCGEELADYIARELKGYVSSTACNNGCCQFALTKDGMIQLCPWYKVCSSQDSLKQRRRLLQSLVKMHQSANKERSMAIFKKRFKVYGILQDSLKRLWLTSKVSSFEQLMALTYLDLHPQILVKWLSCPSTCWRPFALTWLIWWCWVWQRTVVSLYPLSKTYPLR